MKNILLFLLLLAAIPCFAQQKENCYDVVYLRNGSILRGKIAEYNLGGDLAMTTWNGAQMRFPSSNVKKIKQHCRNEDRTPLSQRPYSFRESGWYHCSRAEIMISQNGVGLGLQHSSGLKINRWLGLGLGVGIENLTLWNDDIDSYPVFGEVRGYFLPRNISPFYAFGAGWGFVGKRDDFSDFNGFVNKWQGGGMAQGQIGYRIGNHCTVHVGLRFQRKTRIWRSWNVEGEDSILQKRFEMGVGILL